MGISTCVKRNRGKIGRNRFARLLVRGVCVDSPKQELLVIPVLFRTYFLSWFICPIFASINCIWYAKYCGTGHGEP